MTEQPFEVYRVVPHPDEALHQPWMRLTYDGEMGQGAIDFALRDLENLKLAIRAWEAAYYAD